MPIYLCERLTFDKLFRVSDPKRVYRSFTVRGPPLEIDSYQDAVYYAFNFKANPSTTGLRHRGYVKFFKPKNKDPKTVPLQHLECIVDCPCPDFRYRWAWADKQRGSSRVGPDSLNQAWNKAPRKTNPTGRPGLCKHILAARKFIYGLIDTFPGDEPDTAEKLNKLTKIAQKRWTDFEGEQRAARERERILLGRRDQRNLGRPAVPPPEEEEPGIGVPAPPPETPAFQPIPPGQRGRQLPTALPTPALAVPPGERGRQLPVGQSPKEKRVIGNRKVRLRPPAEESTTTNFQNLILDHVVNANGDKNMSTTLKEAIKLVDEMADEELLHRNELGGSDDPTMGDMGGMDAPSDESDFLEPTEPPMSDSALGADTEGETALGLLTQMKDALVQIATAVAPEQDMMPGEEELGAGAPGEGGGGAGPLGMPDEPPSEESEEGGGEGEGAKKKKREDEEEEDHRPEED